jgi:hypothetical protein
LKDDYHIDLEKYSLDEFKIELLESEIIPSRKILKEEINERFKILEDNGIGNLQELRDSLKNPKKAREFGVKSGLPEKYLLILLREVNSYTPNPVNLEKFPGVKKETINKLKSAGIKNTAHLFKIAKTPEDREKLAAELEIHNAEILELTKLTDLTRIKWIGPVFARLFYDSSTDTARKVSDADAHHLYKQLVKINNAKGYTRAKFIESDVELAIKVSKMVPKVIEYL